MTLKNDWSISNVEMFGSSISSMTKWERERSRQKEREKKREREREERRWSEQNVQRENGRKKLNKKWEVTLML